MKTRSVTLRIDMDLYEEISTYAIEEERSFSQQFLYFLKRGKDAWLKEREIIERHIGTTLSEEQTEEKIG